MRQDAVETDIEGSPDRERPGWDTVSGISSYELRLDDVALETHHIATSRRLIAEAHQLADRGSLIVTGCGSCREIPIERLIDTPQVHLVDIDTEALEGLRGDLSARGVDLDGVTFVDKDITGLVALLARRAESALTTTTNADDACHVMAHLLDDAEPDFRLPENGGRYSLIVCSLVLTQLQAVVLSRLVEVFLARYPAGGALLAAHGGWRDAAFRFARSLEEALVDHLRSISTRGAIVYVSSTVRMCLVTRTAPGVFSTAGFWVAAKTGRLSDYFTSGFEVVDETSWLWFLPKQEHGFEGRLYDVQALTLRRTGDQEWNGVGSDQNRSGT